MKCIIEGIDFYQLEAMKYFIQQVGHRKRKKKMQCRKFLAVIGMAVKSGTAYL